RISDGRLSADGRFDLILPDVKPGIYTLRVDLLNAGGRVGSRFETPFKREDPEVLAALTSEAETVQGLSASLITVQPGFTLWGIANERYGDGLQYVKVFDANRELIRDPDLIYPGQVFDLPE
ncbi:MAG: LysM peptidoglycan-binding domain-containing protein, partial [Pseudomonadota bacterium]